MRRANRYKHPRAHTHTRTHTHTEWEWTSWVILLFLPSAFPFRLLLPSIICLSPPSLPLSRSLNLSLSLCEGHAIDFPLSIHFSRLALKRGKQTKATSAPPLPSIPLLSPLLQPPPLASLSAGPRPIQKPSDRGGGVEECNPPLLHLLSLPALLSFLSSFSLYSFFICPFPLLLRPLLPFSWISDHIPLTELKSCITLKTLPMHCG